MMRGVIRTFFALLALAAPPVIQSQTIGSGDGYNYSVNASDTNTITLFGYDGPGGSITIPTNINGLTVSGIGSGGTNDVFANTGVTIVVIPGSVLSVGAGAFAGCVSLTSVIAPGSATNLGAAAFADCTNLTSVYFNGNAPSADATAFNSDTNATIYYLAGTAGWGATLAGLPAVSSTPQDQFSYITNAGAITITGFSGGGDAIIPDAINGLLVTSIGTNTTYAYDGTNYASLTIPYSVTNLGAEAFTRWGYQMASVSLPGSLTNIGDEAFFNGAVASVTIGYGVTSIGASAFQGCGNLNVVTIPNSVTSIGANAFNSASLTNLTIPGSVTNLGAYAFAGTLEGKVTIPGSVISIGSNAFSDCIVMASLTIENGVTSIGAGAFSGPGEGGERAGNAHVTIPGSVTNIGEGAFEGCEFVSSVTIDNGVTSIGDYAFSGSALGSITIPDSVTYIGLYAFNDTGLSSVTIPDGITSIADMAFANTFLSSVTIPASVTNIGVGAFLNTYLSSVFFGGDAPSGGAAGAFGGAGPNSTAYYWPGTTGWSAFSSNSSVPSVLWNPLIQAGGTNFGVRNNQFGFTITNGSTTNIPIMVEACTNLANPVWVPLQTLTLSNSFYFTDSDWTNYPARFYALGFP